jgi:uncharacterized protein (DUF1778 family)
MSSRRLTNRSRRTGLCGVLRIRLDEESMALLTQAAVLRRVSLSDYVRLVAVGQARREVLAARKQTLALTPEEQLAFWKALGETPRLTKAQRRLSKSSSTTSRRN